MTDLQVYSLVISCVIGIVGLVIAIRGALTLSKCKSSEMIMGEIIDIFQEYTARGFLWKAKVQYECNGKRHFYITRARSFKRGTAEIPLYISENGTIYEKGHAISVLATGIGVIIGAIALVIALI